MIFSNVFHRIFSSLQYVVAYGFTVRGNIPEWTVRDHKHFESDTLLLCSIRELVQLNKALSFKIVSLDTDVLVLSVDYLVNSPYPVEIEFELITSRGCRTLSVNTIVEELGEEKSKALLGFLS